MVPKSSNENHYSAYATAVVIIKKGQLSIRLHNSDVSSKTQFFVGSRNKGALRNESILSVCKHAIHQSECTITFRFSSYIYVTHKI